MIACCPIPSEIWLIGWEPYKTKVSQYLSLPDFKSELSDLLHGLGVVEREAAVIQLGIADLLLADVLVVQVPGGEQVQNGCLSPHTMVI